MKTWAEKISEYLDMCAYQKKLDEKTVKAYRIDLNQFRTRISGETEIGKTEIAGFLEFLNKTYKPKSVKRKIASLKAYFMYLEFEEYIAVNPFSKMRIKFREPATLPRTIPLDSIRKILCTVYAELKRRRPCGAAYRELLRDIAVLELLFATGMRVSELCGLSRKDVSLDARCVRILGKGAKERIIQIGNAEVLAALQNYEQLRAGKEADGGMFFTNRTGRQLSTQSVRLMIRKYTKAASIPLHITPHMFRHSFATLLLEEDVDIRYIQHLLGHSSITTTQIYTHVTGKKQRLILATKHPRNKLSVQ